MIYKGCEKRMIMLKNTGSDLFEEAYFILSNKKNMGLSRNDMIKEANRIISENNITSSCEKKTSHFFLQYILGFLSGIGTAAVIMMLLIWK
ncbi:MAG: hypothetical protein IJA55_10815 [Clostridia bacterium]|nr:hypothetical protein [Clostridia bacterium]